MEMIGKVRRMKLREQLSNSEIAKRTGLSRNTVKKWLKAPGDEAPKYRRGKGKTKLSEYEATLVQALRAASSMPASMRCAATTCSIQTSATWHRAGRKVSKTGCSLVGLARAKPTWPRPWASRG